MRRAPGAIAWPCVPGLPDEAFESDGMLTRRDVRAATLARLVPLAGQCLWDVGAGSGAVAIEWLRALRRGRAVAIERDPERCARIERNAQRLGTPELVVAQGSAPAALDGPAAAGCDLPRRRPQRARPARALLAGAAAGRPAGRQCGHARGRAGPAGLAGQASAASWSDLMIARAEPVGRFDGWRPAMPVTQLAATRP